jgi:hypothetical protein
LRLVVPNYLYMGKEKHNSYHHWVQQIFPCI